MSIETNLTVQQPTETTPADSLVITNQQSQVTPEVFPPVPKDPIASQMSERSSSGNFFTRRLEQIRAGYDRLSKKQKDAIFLGAMALTVMTFPAYGSFNGHTSQERQTSQVLLEDEVLLGSMAAGGSKLVSNSGKTFMEFVQPGVSFVDSYLQSRNSSNQANS